VSEIHSNCKFSAFLAQPLIPLSFRHLYKLVLSRLVIPFPLAG